MNSIIESINSPKDVKALEIDQLDQLAKELREYLLRVVSNTGGHLSSNLGVVELTLALHYCFNSPYDKLIWDVGHQTYIHKMITGRREELKTIRKINGISGFPKKLESKHDIFETGHSSTSISAALGFVKAREIMQENNYIIPIIGDGSMTGGMAFEALNNAGRLDSNLIVILNDNQMSISRNVGGLSSYLDTIRTGTVYKEMKEEVEKALTKIPRIGKEVVKVIRDVKSGIKQLVIPGMLFEELGFTYLGPVDGHNIPALIKTFNQAKRLNEPILIHVNTIKGKGYKPAELNPTKYHGTKPFFIKNGKPKKSPCLDTYSKVLGDVLINIASEDKKLVAVSAAMPEGTGLNKFARRYPDRFVDVGIAEQHAVTFAAGLASSGMKPVVALYSSFLQRAYDQVLHDVCMQKLPVVFAIDRAGLVGEDGETHQGIFDVSLLNHMPNMTIIAPKNKAEMESMLKYAVDYSDGPIAIRYPKGKASYELGENNQKIEYARSEIIKKGTNIAIIGVGTLTETVNNVSQLLENEGINTTIINARFIKPIDKSLIEEIANTHKYIFTVEENIISGGYGNTVLRYVMENNLDTKVICLGIQDDFVRHGTRKQLIQLCELDEQNIYNKIKTYVE